MRANEFIVEAITRNKVRAALWHEWQQDAWLDQGEQSPEEMDDDEYNDFEETVDRIVAWANEQGIESSQLAVTKYIMAMDQVTMAHLTGSQGLSEDSLNEGWKERIAAGALGAGLALGGQQAYNQYNQPQAPQPQPTIQQQQLSPKSILIQTAKQAGITGDELAQLLAQSAHETLNFTRMREVGTPEYFAKKYETKRKAKILGNKVRGDGERYKGRGFIQLTGRDNYTRAGRALGLPLESQPELAADPANAAKIAVWFWQSRVAPKVADFTNTKAVTKKINPGLKHQQRRQQQFAKYQLARNESA